MKLNKVFLSLGSNLGNKIKILSDAVNMLLNELSGIRCSSIYETKPLYFDSQPYFYNMAVSGNTELNTDNLFKLTSGIEKLLGRNRNKEIKNGPRYIDIDILLFNDLCIKTDKLIIPHPRIEERLFVLVPLKEIDENLVNPLNGRLFSSLIDNLKEQEITKISPAIKT
jgi:2-amino-4-hydroxy-6-hydroxymethyldihydropteridine diphosphokinase